MILASRLLHVVFKFMISFVRSINLKSISSYVFMSFIVIKSSLIFSFKA